MKIVSIICFVVLALFLAGCALTETKPVAGIDASGEYSMVSQSDDDYMSWPMNDTY
jgi:PBP1b-binding outer membrane lipoprotein LpoB